MVKILVVDDESLARQRLLRFIKESGQDVITAEAENGIVAIEKIKSFEPHIVFLDIQMPGLNGFEVLQQIEVRNFQLVFQTAFDEFAIKAFEENACDYLLKPFDLERFQKTMKRINPPNVSSNAFHKTALAGVEKRLGNLDRILIRQGSKTKVISVSEIDYFLSRDHYTCIFSKNSEFISDLSLNYLEERLDRKKFVRTHRNSIVATREIKSIGDTTNSEVTLSCGAKLSLSRRNRKAVLEVMSL